MKVAAADALRIALPLLAARALAPLVARWVPLPRALQFAVVKGPALDVEVAAEVVVGVEALLRLFPKGGGTCLTRSLARAFALRRAGVPVRFVLGVRTDAHGEAAGHSWLELKGAPFLEARVENLRAFQVVYVHDVDSGAR